MTAPSPVAETPRTQKLYVSSAGHPAPEPWVQLCESLERETVQQREQIEALTKKLASSQNAKRPFSDEHSANVIAGQVKEIDRQDTRIREERQRAERAEAEVAEWKRMFQDTLKANGELQAEVARMAAEREADRKALQALVDVQNGPPLVKYAADWHAAMDAAIAALRPSRK